MTANEKVGFYLWAKVQSQYVIWRSKMEKLCLLWRKPRISFFKWHGSCAHFPAACKKQGWEGPTGRQQGQLASKGVWQSRLLTFFSVFHGFFSISEKHSPEEDVTVIEPPSCLSGKLYEMFQDIMTKRPLLGQSHNFLRGLEFHKDYIHQKKFIEWKGNCNKELAALCR